APSEPASEQRQTTFIGSVEYSHDPVTRAARDLEQARARLIDASTARRREVMTGGLTLPNGMHVGTAIDDQNRITSVVANAALAGLTDDDEVDFKAAS